MFLIGWIGQRWCICLNIYFLLANQTHDGSFSCPSNIPQKQTTEIAQVNESKHLITIDNNKYNPWEHVINKNYSLLL